MVGHPDFSKGKMGSRNMKKQVTKLEQRDSIPRSCHMLWVEAQC
jgi:hypothetical protein